MALHSRSRLFGLLLILASLPLDPGTALATTTAASAPPAAPANAAAEAMEARLQRIAAALREQGIEAGEGSSIPADAVAWVGWNNGGVGVGWGNGGWGNGFRNGNWGNGGFGNGGWGNGGFRNGGWGNGGGGFRNFRNW